MRILAIRGGNLASLKGSFAVDLSRPPLCHHGLFAIAGPVGAGKSTILDAMCLALFNRTPRLSGRGGSPLLRDKDALKSNDPRSLVRRGAAKAFAEVDFAAGDGRVWRARWQVHRARGQAFGKLQDEVLSLHDVETGQRLGEGKEGTLAEIERRLGLSFDEFCRSVLLSQGGFSTFMKARPDERASLLEKITGTDIYSTISVEAWQRAREEVGRLRALDDELAAMPPLGPEERHALEAAARSCADERARAEGDLARAEALVRHRQERASLARALEEARDALHRARERRASAPAAASIGELERAWPLRPLVRDRDESAAAHEAARRVVAEAVAAERRARSALDGAREHRGRAQDAQAAAARALAAAEPALQRALILDEIIERAALPELAEASARADAACAAAEAALEEARAAQMLQAREAADAEALLAKDATLGALVPTWPTLERELRQLAHDDTQAEGARAIALAAAHKRDEAQAACEELVAQRDAARSRIEDLRARLAALLPEGPDAAGLATARGLRERALDLEARAERAHARGLELAAAGDEARRAERAASAERDHCAASYAEARTRLAELERAAARAALVEGEPCPVCGSASHPALDARHEQPPPAVVAEERRCAAQALAELEERLASRVEGRAAAAARLAELAGALARARQETAELTAARAALGPVPSAEELAAADALVDEAGAAARDLAALEAAQAEAVAFHASAEDAHALHVRVLEAHLAARDGRARSLTESLGDDIDLATPRPALQLLGPRIAALKDRQRRAHQARGAVAAAEPHVRVLEQEVAAQRARAGELEARLGRLRAETTVLAEERRALFDGEPAPTLRARLTSALEDASAAAAEAGSACAAAEARLHEAEGRALEVARAELTAHHRRDQAALALEAALLRTAVAEDAAVRAASLADGALEDARATLRSIDVAIARAEAVLAERQAALAAHEASAPVGAGGEAAGCPVERSPIVSAIDGSALDGSAIDGSAIDSSAVDSSAMEDVVAAARDRLAAATDAWSAARAALLQDDGARARAAELLPAREAQHRRAATWSALADVIGSSDGARFRVFAQSLTLDALLVHANAQLRALAPRYRLERARAESDKRARFDLDLVVVDSESGDELRSVGSLSGGESFLVSLALALGLSSLSAARTRVDSLFIDEGFSSLDPETLEAALGALEALRVTGRQLGVISHLPALVERLGAQVRVVPLGAGRSRVDIADVHVA
jgi:DNA repair protein SbcC/Rad50